MITDQPAPVSTSAAVAPAGPVPTMTASQSGTGSGTTADFLVGVTARLGVAGKLDRVPAAEVAITAVLGRTVCTFARVLVQELTQLVVRGEPAVLLAAVDGGEVGTERGDPLAIDLLPAQHPALELPLGQPP